MPPPMPPPMPEPPMPPPMPPVPEPPMPPPLFAALLRARECCGPSDFLLSTVLCVGSLFGVWFLLITRRCTMPGTGVPGLTDGLWVGLSERRVRPAGSAGADASAGSAGAGASAGSTAAGAPGSGSEHASG